MPKQPPHSIEAEQSVLGALMLDNALWLEVAELLKPADFYRQDHQAIFEGISQMSAAGQTCDFVTLSEHLRERGLLEQVGGASYLGLLATDCFSVTNVLSYAQIVRERSGLRSMIAAGAQIMGWGYETEGRSLGELLERAEQKVLGISELGASEYAEGAHIGPLIDQARERLELLAKNKGMLPGIATGFTDLDRETQGLEPGDLVIVAARPSMGKTSFASCIAENVAIKQRKAVAIFSLEMSGAQIALRILSSFGRVPLKALRSGALTEADYDRLAQAERFVRDAPLYVDESPALTPLDLRRRARRLVARHQVKLIIVDYIQLMRVPDSESRTNEVAEISRSLKGLAKELGVPVIALSQLNRGLETRDNKRPRLADLRESGSIEQDADLVLFVYRDEVYNEATEDRGKAEIIIGKQRNGPLGTVTTAFLGQYTRFENLADERYAERS